MTDSVWRLKRIKQDCKDWWVRCFLRLLSWLGFGILGAL